MLSVYINYPNPHVTCHYDRNCGRIRPQKRPNQRICHVNWDTISSELKKFRDKQYPFRAEAKWNDIWLELDFQDNDFERTVLDLILKLIRRYYKPLANVNPQRHC